MSSAWAPLLWFAAIVALIPLSLWLLKRTPIGGAASGAGAMRQVSTLPLSANQRVVTVEVGSGADRRWLVLGVTPGSISTLHTMPPQAEVPAAGVPSPPFAQLMSRLRQGDRS
jgi:flagellar protein FliO/FliZ